MGRNKRSTRLRDGIYGGLTKTYETASETSQSTNIWTAKEEFDRMMKYFYVKSESPIASPLVVAPKATKQFIRICGDYRRVNKYLKMAQHVIPNVQHEL